MVAYARQLGAETTIVALNAGSQSRRLDLPVGSLLAEGAILNECWSHDVIRVEQAKLHDLVLHPRSGRVLASAS